MLGEFLRWGIGARFVVTSGGGCGESVYVKHTRGLMLGGGLAGGMAELLRYHAQVKHIEHNEQVDDDDQQPEPGGAMKEVGNFEGDIDAAGDGGHPLGPGQGKPEAVGFDETENHVDGDDESDFPEAHVADAGDEVDEHADEMMVGTDVEEFEQAFGDSPDTFVAHGEQAEPGENNDHTFGELDGGDGAQATDVLGIPDD